MDTTRVTSPARFSFNIGLCAPFAVGLLIVAGTYNNAFSYFALFLSALVILSFSQEDALCLMMFTMPFANIFKSNPDAQSFFTYLLFFYSVCMLFKRRSVSTSFVLWLLFFTAYLGLQSFVSLNFFRILKFVFNLFFIYFAVNTKTSNDRKNVFLYYVLGIVISSFVSFLRLAQDLDLYIGAKSLGYEHGEMARFAGLYGDPNYYSVNIVVSLCLVVLLLHKKQINILGACILSAPLVMFSIMTYSKSAFLMLPIPVFMILYSKIKSKKYFLSFVFAIAAFILAISALSGKVEIFDTVISRFNDDSNPSVTTGRAELWRVYVDHLRNSPIQFIIGGGFGADIIGERAAHNTYIDMIYYLGLFGTAILIPVFATIGKSIPSPPKKNLLNYSVLAVIAVMYFFLSELFYFDMAFHLALIILVYKTDFQLTYEE